MKRVILAAAGAAAGLFVIAAGAQSPPLSDEPLFRAMRDEIERAHKLSLPNLETPYYIEYGIDEQETFSASASLGGVMTRHRERFRNPSVFVRVGDYKFDNSNYLGGGGGSRYDLGRFPIEDNYQVLRRYLWLQADSAYKGAVEAVSRKRAALRNITQTDQLTDFAKAEPLHFISKINKLDVDENAWVKEVRSLSAVFSQFPDIKGSAIDLEVTEGGHYLENSEGTEVRTPESVTVLRARATAQASDGSTLHDFLVFNAAQQKDLPKEAEVTRAVTSMAQNLIALSQAPKGPDYIGPVLFDGAASAQLFAQLLGENLTVTRQMAGGRGGGAPLGELEGRLGARVLPDSFNVVDDPSLKEYNGHKLFGSYEVDREGVPAKPLNIVEKGALKNYLLTRQPVRGFEGSNGRARFPGAAGTSQAGISNLIVTSSDTIPASDLKKKLVELIQQRARPFGIIVRKLDYPSTATTEEAVRLIRGQSGNPHPISAPLLVYKVFPDGHEELVRGMEFHNLTARSLRDIIVAGSDSTQYDFMNSVAPFALVGAASYTIEASVVAPSVLLDEVELRAVEGEQPKPPLVTAPDFQK